MKMSTDHIGNTTEAAVMTALLKKGFTVLVPWGGGAAYDLAVELGGKFSKIQCKTGRITKGVVYYHTDSTHREYGDAIDFFGVYCPANGKTYLVPIPGRSLRVTPTKNNQKKGIWLAEEFEI
jgi:PD-(D/E)XK endonuclease